MESQFFNAEAIAEKIMICSNQNLSDIERLDLLLNVNKEIDNEIKNLTTDGEHTYASLLKLKMASIVFKTEITDERSILWSPEKYSKYQSIRKMITAQTGNLGKIITKTQYEQALQILKKIH